MDTETIAAVLSAGIAVIAAILAIYSTSAAKDQAESARESATAAEAQAFEAERQADSAEAQVRQIEREYREARREQIRARTIGLIDAVKRFETTVDDVVEELATLPGGSTAQQRKQLTDRVVEAQYRLSTSGIDLVPHSEDISFGHRVGEAHGLARHLAPRIGAMIQATARPEPIPESEIQPLREAVSRLRENWVRLLNDVTEWSRQVSSGDRDDRRAD
jgi:hypothetical protein